MASAFSRPVLLQKFVMLKLGSFRNKNLLVAYRQLSTLQNASNEYSEEPEYPPILDPSLRAKKGRRLHEWYEKIKKIGTIEEKFIELNLPRYYGHKCLMLDDKMYPYNTLPFFQYATNTEFVNTETHAPAVSEEEAKKVDNFLNLIRSDLQDALEFELDGYQ